MRDDPKGNTMETVANGQKFDEVGAGGIFNDCFLCCLLQFVKNMMLYENEISLPDDEELNQKTLREEPEYE